MAIIHDILKKYWGYSKFRPLQEEIIQSVLDDKDTLALLPTGGGKSLCFQVPGMAKEGVCLVISPLIALMKDQVYNLNQRGIKAAAIFSGMKSNDIDAVLSSCAFGETKFLYISPERLTTDAFKVNLERINISLLAVDEAHCISQWGYDFRPPYLEIAAVRDRLKNVPIIALTATATLSVVEDIQEKLKFKTPNVLRKSFVRKNLSYVVRQSDFKEKTLLYLLGKVPGTAVVYVRNRKKTKQIADFLKANHISSDFYHAGLNNLERSQKQEDWINNKIRVIVCTNAFGMGIDKPDVRLVVHIDLADSLEAYFQEAGRAGRDEKKAYAVQLVGDSDLDQLQEKIINGYPSLEILKLTYEKLMVFLRVPYHSGANQSFDFDLIDFADVMKMSPIIVHQSLKVLEQQSFFYMSESVSKPSQIMAKADKETLFRFQSQYKELEPMVKFILRTSEGVFEDYVSVEEEQYAPRLKISPSEVIRQLHQLHQFNIFSYQPRKDKPQITLLRDRVRTEHVHFDMAFLAARKTDYETKLLAMQKYIEDIMTCRTRSLVSYFGEVLEKDCGVCDVCIGKKKVGLPINNFGHLIEEIKSVLKVQPMDRNMLFKQLNRKTAEISDTLSYLSDVNNVYTDKDNIIYWREHPNQE